MPSDVIDKIIKILGKGTHQLHEPFFQVKEWQYVKKTLDDNLVSSIGPFVNKFENKLKNYTRSKYVISTTNGTSALYLSLLACGVERDDEVLVPTITFVATANAVAHLGAIPHFIDSEIDTLGIDVEKLEKYLKKNSIKKGKFLFNKKTKRRIRAVVPVHVFGNICKINELIKLARKFNIFVIEDATEALGSFLQRKHAGTFGLVGCLSFNGNKILTTGGGGAILTDNKKIAIKMKHLSTTAKVKHKWEFIHDDVGYNLRMPNINAALGLAQLESLKKHLVSKKVLYKKYFKEFEKSKKFFLIKNPPESSSNNWLNTIYLRKASIKHRDKVIKAGHKKKIFLRPVWKPLHTLKPFKSCPKMNLNNAIKIYNSCINLPSSARYFFK